MNNQMSSQLQSQPPKGYFDAFGDAFQRIWKNRILWIWGIFLGIGGGFSFNGGSGGGTEEFSIAEAEQFFNEFWWVFPLVGIIGFLIGIAFWVVSTIVRPGVTRALDRLQNNPDSKPKHQDIWEQGKMKFVEIIKLDLIIFLINLGAFIVLAIIAAILIGAGIQSSGNTGLIIPLILVGVVLLAIFIFFVIVTNIIKILGSVFISLSDMNWSIVIKKSWNLARKNKMEVLKLFLIIMLINLISGLAGMIVIGLISGILISLSVVILSMENLIVVGGILLAISVLVIISLFLLLKAFSSLWSQDVIVWWVKKMQGIKVPQEKKLKDGVTEEVQSAEAVAQGGLVLEGDN